MNHGGRSATNQAFLRTVFKRKLNLKTQKPPQGYSGRFYLANCRCRLHVVDHYLTKARAAHLCRAFHKASEVVRYFFGMNRLFH